MARKKKSEMGPYEGLRVRGFVHLQVVNKKTGDIVGETHTHNVVTNYGKDEYIINRMAGLSGSVVAVDHLVLSEKTDAILSNHETIASEIGGRKLLADTTNAASNRKQLITPGTLRFVCSWDGTDLGTDSPVTIGNIAAFNTNAAGSLMSGASYVSSQWTSDQNVNATYELQFS